MTEERNSLSPESAHPAAKPSREVAVALAARDELGEGTSWLADTRQLLRVDIANGLVHTWRPDTDETSTINFGGEVGAAVSRQGGGLIVAVDHDLLLVDPDGTRTKIATVEADRKHNRFNDCRCDPQGRLWAGTMSTIREPGLAGLYRLNPGEQIELVIGETTLSNGIGWSPDGERMYFIDSTTQRIDVLDFDGADGSVANRRPFAEIPLEAGMPDGLTVDAEGQVWVCLFGGGAIRCYGADGSLEEHIELPVPHVTCPAFGGEDLGTLFITTTRHRLTPEQQHDLPIAGSVLSLRPGVLGMASNRFGG